MAQTQVIIIYSIGQNRRRRTIHCDDADYTVHAANIVDGEAVCVVSLDDYNTIGPEALLAKHTGAVPASDRCVVLNSAGLVIDVCCADPNIDRHTSGTLVRHDEAAIGWSCAAGVWTPPPPEVPISLGNGIMLYPSIAFSIVPAGTWNTDWIISAVGDTLNIGCESHLISEWQAFKDSRITLMDTNALVWWTQYKTAVMNYAAAHLNAIQQIKAVAI